MNTTDDIDETNTGEEAARPRGGRRQPLLHPLTSPLRDVDLSLLLLLFLVLRLLLRTYSRCASRSYGSTQTLRRMQRSAARLHLAYTRDSHSEKLEIFIPLFVSSTFSSSLLLLCRMCLSHRRYFGRVLSLSAFEIKERCEVTCRRRGCNEQSK